MASIQSSHSNHFGRQRHYKAEEWIYFWLADGAGAPYTGGTIGTGAGKVAVTIELPDDSSHDIHAGGVPSNAVEEIGGGLYRLRLFGSGQSTPHDKPLLQVGRYGIRIYSTVGEFETVVGAYDVVPDFEINLACVYTAGTGGSDTLRGAVSFYHWHTHELLTTPQSALTSISLVIRDETGTAIINLTNLSTDFTQFNDSLFFSKATAGLSGNHVLVARVSAVYKGHTYAKDVMMPARFAA